MSPRDKRSFKTLAHSELKRSLIGAFLYALWLVYYFQNKDGSSLSSSWKQRSPFFSVWDLKGGQNSCLIVWKTVTLPLEAAARNNSKIVCRLFTLPSVFRRMCLSFNIDVNATRLVIGRCPWFIRVQIHRWSHEKLIFFVLFNHRAPHLEVETLTLFIEHLKHTPVYYPQS